MQAPLYFRRRCLRYAYKWDARVGARDFVCFGPCIFPLTFLPVCVGGRGCKHFSTLVGGACGMHISGTEGWARFFLCVFALVFFHLHIYPGVCVGQEGQVPLYSRRRRLWYAYTSGAGRRARGIFFGASALVFVHLHISWSV